MTMVRIKGHYPLKDMPSVLVEYGLRISYYRLWIAAHEGKIPAIKVGGRWQVPQSRLKETADYFDPLVADTRAEKAEV